MITQRINQIKITQNTISSNESKKIVEIIINIAKKMKIKLAICSDRIFVLASKAEFIDAEYNLTIPIIINKIITDV